MEYGDSHAQDEATNRLMRAVYRQLDDYVADSDALYDVDAAMKQLSRRRSVKRPSRGLYSGPELVDAPFWQMLTAAEQTALESAGRTDVFARGDALSRQGDRTSHVFIVLDGWVKITSVTRDGKQLVLALRGMGELIGEMEGETGAPRAATMQACTTVPALMVEHDPFDAFLRMHPNAERAYRRGLVQRWTETATTMTIRATLQAAQRLAGLLLDLADQYGTAIADGIDIEVPLTQEELGSLAGTTRATVARAFAVWRDRGLIRTAHRSITIIEVDPLRKIARR